MNEGFLGDSFDIVKRFWREQLGPIAPLLAHPRFVPAALRERFTHLTAIPFFDPSNPPTEPFGMFLDPHTGVPFPKDDDTEATPAYAPTLFIIAELARLKPRYAICFDQCHDRLHDVNRSREWQQGVKREFLRDRGIPNFYYQSHAPFLFLATVKEHLVEVRHRLIEVGIPEQTPDGYRLQAIMG